MESIMIAFTLAAVAMLLLGYRRAARQADDAAPNWLFAYRSATHEDATRDKSARE